MFMEIFIYLVIVLGIIVLTSIMFEKDVCSKEKYMLIKKDDANVKVTLEIKGLSKEDAKRIKWIIGKGKYEDILDIANEFEVKEE